MINFDKEIEDQRRKYDLQEAEVIHTCDRCTCEIYEGNTYYFWQAMNANLCENCFDEIQAMEKKEAERIAGEEEE